MQKVLILFGILIGLLASTGCNTQQYTIVRLGYEQYHNRISHEDELLTVIVFRSPQGEIFRTKCTGTITHYPIQGDQFSDGNCSGLLVEVGAKVPLYQSLDGVYMNYDSAGKFPTTTRFLILSASSEYYGEGIVYGVVMEATGQILRRLPCKLHP